MTTSSQVSIGPSSILGWVAATAGLVTSTVQSLENSQSLVAGPGKWPAILGVLALVATNLGRQFQAAHLTKAAALTGHAVGVLGIVEGVLPTLEQELGAQPPAAPLAESRATPDGAVQAAPPAAAAPVGA